eukprot:GHVU01010653.1.p1 GENE.GHVU01010653.1~~GHVU01010653.1.p1  ORF type:complete len:133 (+),score=7.43 GHVU01010653.1:64-462(+)
MFPSSHLSIAGRAAQQRHNSSGGGVWGCWRGSGQTAAVGHRPSDCGMRTGAKEDPTHIQTYADSPPHAQPVPVPASPISFVPYGPIPVSEDAQGYTQCGDLHTHTHTHIDGHLVTPRPCRRLAFLSVFTSPQ